MDGMQVSRVDRLVVCHIGEGFILPASQGRRSPPATSNARMALSQASKLPHCTLLGESVGCSDPEAGVCRKSDLMNQVHLGGCDLRGAPALPVGNLND
jgi:hypothetical protein